MPARSSGTYRYSPRMLLHILLISLLGTCGARSATKLISPVDGRSVCTSQECREFAQEIQQNMNASADPCVDFYEYACGRWPENNPMPEKVNVWTVQSIAQDRIKRQIIDILKSEPLADDVRSVRLAKKWYTACINTEDIEKRGMEPLLSVLAASGGWPMLMESSELRPSKYYWQRVDDYYANLTGSNGFHEIRVAAYGAGATAESAVLDVPDLPSIAWLLLSEVDIFGEETSSENTESTNESGEQKQDKKINIDRNGRYATFVYNVSIALADAGGFNVLREKLLDEIIDMLAFQVKLQKLTLDIQDYVNVTLDGFQQLSDSLTGNTDEFKIDWSEKIKAMFHRAGVEVDGNLNMKITSPKYFGNVIRLLQKTPQRTIVNYLHWNFVSKMIATMNKDMRKMFYNLSSHEPDGDKEEPLESRSDSCLDEVQMADIYAYAYVHTYFSDDAKNAAFDIMEDIKQEIETQINESSWLNDEIKARLLGKLRTIKKMIGYPEYYNDRAIMENYLGNLELGSAYFENAISYKRYATLKSLRKLNGEKETRTWIVNPTTVNLLYTSSDNTISVPVAVLNPPFFSFNRPNTVNYGLVGFLLGHEMNHPFDQSRHELAEDGTREKWPQDMSATFNDSAQHFVDQFNNYSIACFGDDPIEDYGERTLDDNMSDTMGLRVAYRAYLQRERKKGRPEDALPDLERFNNDQIFFLSFANLWCESIRVESRRFVALLNEHSIGLLRVMGSLTNSEDFAAAFNCPAGSPMNPERKGSVWN